MKRHVAGIIILLLIGTFSWGQGTREPFDVKRSKEELEIMKGILNTTLTFFVQNTQKEGPRQRFSSLNAFYLAGQGAVFVVPSYRVYGTSPIIVSPFSLGPEFSEQMASLNKELSEYSRQLTGEATRQALAGRYGIGSGIGGGVGGGAFAPAPPAVPAAPAPPTPPAQSGSSAVEKPPKPEKPEKPAPPELDRDKLRKAIDDAQERVKKSREEAEANREKLLQSLSEVKVYLIEALANYGDSLTTVKPEEYINIVILTDNFDPQSTRSDVLSARKSWITDYKAGRLNLEGFKQKVIQYTE